MNTYSTGLWFNLIKKYLNVLLNLAVYFIFRNNEQNTLILLEKKEQEGHKQPNVSTGINRHLNFP